MCQYEDEQIKAAKILLEGLEVSGVENCKRVVMLRQILDGQKVEEKESSGDGSR